MLQFNALNGLQQLGTTAKSALPVLEKFAAGLPDGNLKDTTRKTIDKLKEEPKPAEITDLEKAREEIKRLRKELEDIRKKVEKK